MENSFIQTLNLSQEDKEKFASEIAKFDQAVQQDANDYLAFVRLGTVFYYCDKLDYAAQSYRKALELNSNDADVHFCLGVVLGEQNKLQEAVNTCKRAIELDSEHAGAHNGLGIALSKLGSANEEAVKASTKAIQLNPKNGDAYICLSSVLMRQAKRKEAIEAFEKAVQINPDFAENYNSRGLALIDKLSGDDAKNKKIIILQPNPNHGLVYIRLAATFKPKDNEEAAKVCEKAIQINPKDVNAYRTLAIVLRFQGKLDECINAYYKAIEIDSSDSYTFFNLGLALVQKGKLDEAVTCFRKSIELNPQGGHGYMNLGETLRKLAKFDDAIEALNKAIELDPKDASAHNSIGLCFRQKGKPDEAVTYFKKTLEIDPRASFGYANLGDTLRQLNKPEEAIEALNKAIELGYKESIVYNNLGIMLNMQNKVMEAIAAFNKAIEMNPQNGIYYCNRAKALVRVAREDLIMADLNKIAELVNTNKFGNEVARKDREALLGRLLPLQQVVINLGNMNLGPRIDLLQKEIEVLKELRGVQRGLTIQVVDRIEKVPQNDKEQVMPILMQKMQEMETRMILLQKQIIEQVNANPAVPNSGYDKNQIKDEFNMLAMNTPEVFKYCFLFYWTLNNYFAAYHSLAASGNTNVDQATKEKLFEQGIKRTSVVAMRTNTGAPFATQAINVLDSIIDPTFTVKEGSSSKVNVISKILARCVDKRPVNIEDINFVCAQTAFGLACSKKDLIQKASVSRRTSKHTSSLVPEVDKGKMAELIQAILPSTGLPESPAIELALKDAASLLMYVINHNEKITGSTEALDQQLMDVLLVTLKEEEPFSIKDTIQTKYASNKTLIHLMSLIVLIIAYYLYTKA